MIASTWYCIAQTSTFDTSCSINVTFDGYDIQFSASVKLGISAINITRCTIPDGIIFSIRLRESGSQWFIDLNSNTNISPVVTIADNEYWSIVNKPASEGNIILQLYDITSKYNTSTGGDSLFEIINVGSVDTPRYAVVPKIFQGQNPGVISRTFMTFGGLGTNSGDEEDSQGGVSYLRNLLDVGLADFLEDEDVLTYDKHSNLWVNKKGGFNEEKLQEYLDKHKYITEEYVKDLMELLKWFEFDEINNAVRVKSDFNFIVPNALSFGGLGTDSGDGEAGASYLKNLLDVQLGTILKDGEALVYDKHLGCWVNKAIETGLDLNALQKYLTDNDYITSASLSGLEDQVVQNKADIALLLSWLEYDKVNNAIRVKNGHNFIVDGTLSFGGAGNDDEATQEGLTQVTIQLGDNPNNSYTTENGVIKLPSYPVVPTKVSSFENDAKYITKAELDGIENEFAEIKEDLNALNDLLNDDVAGVINTWDEVVDFLNEYSESQDLASILSQMNADIANRVLYEDFEKLEDSVADIAGYFTNGSANNALKLGGQLPSHYATQSALNAAITNITAIGERVTTLEDLGLVRVREGSTYYIKSIYSIVSEGELISGRRASGSSSDVTGGGGISQVTAQMIADALGYVPYSSQNPSGYITSSALNGYAKTSDIPSLSGYATQAWVEGKKYLTAIPSEYITETELSNTLGSYQTKITSSNKLAYSLISGTPTLATVATSGKYSDLSGVPTSLPASDVYAWAKAATKPSYTASEVGALSTSGGTITGLVTFANNEISLNGVDLAYNSTSLRIRTPYGDSWCGMMNETACHIYTNAPIFYMNKQLYVDNGNAVIHSGNIGSQSVDAATRLVRVGSITDANTITFTDYSLRWYSAIANTATNLPSFSGYQNGLLALPLHSSGTTAQIYMTAGNGLYFRGNTGVDWKTIAFTDSNVASATKLQTARSIWGQSFDGTGNVRGAITDATSLRYNANNSCGIYVRGSVFTSAATDDDVVISSLNKTIFYGGNVLIGTTTDNGAKLQVSGNLTATGEVISTRRASSSDARLKDNINRLLAEDCLAMVRNLQPSSWDWKENGEHSMGFIAQDIEPLMPYAVTRIKDDKLGEKLNLQYDQFFAPVVGAIQCLDSEVEQLKKRVKYLENKLQEHGYNRY